MTAENKTDEFLPLYETWCGAVTAAVNAFCNREASSRAVQPAKSVDEAFDAMVGWCGINVPITGSRFVMRFDDDLILIWRPYETSRQLMLDVISLRDASINRDQVDAIAIRSEAFA